MKLLTKTSVPSIMYGKVLWVPRPGMPAAHRHQPPRFVAISGTREECLAASPDPAGPSMTSVSELRIETSSESPAPGTTHHHTTIPAADADAATAAATVTASTATQPPQAPGFIARRLLVFSGLILGYAAYYLTRNSLTYTAPVMVADPTLGFTLAQVGTMTSIFPIAYGLSKFVSGILGDKYSPSLLLGGGLMLTAACNLALGAGHGLAWFGSMWALNGLLQGVGAPSCARMLTSWFAARERGTYWGLWNVAHNTGGFLSPLVAATAAHLGGWRWGMWAPGLAGLVLGLYVMMVCRDTPQDAGYQSVESVPQTTKTSPSSGSSSATSRSSSNGNGNGNGCAGEAAATAASSNGNNSKQQPGVLRLAIDNVLSNPYIWALALTYFCVYIVRQGVTTWTVFYLINEKGVPDAAQAAMRVSGLELGGLVGGLAAGGLSDFLIRSTSSGGAGAAANGISSSSSSGRPVAGSVGKRVQVVMSYTAALAVALAAFQALPAGAPPAVQWLSVAAIGFFIYGPQMLIGLCGAELVNPGSVGASQGVLGWIAYLGAANAGLPLSWIITKFGWPAYFTTLTAACGVALLLLAPLMRLPSYSQRQQQQERQLTLQETAPAGDMGLKPKLA